MSPTTSSLQASRLCVSLCKNHRQSVISHYSLTVTNKTIPSELNKLICSALQDFWLQKCRFFSELSINKTASTQLQRNLWVWTLKNYIKILPSAAFLSGLLHWTAGFGLYCMSGLSEYRKRWAESKTQTDVDLIKDNHISPSHTNTGPETGKTETTWVSHSEPLNQWKRTESERARSDLRFMEKRTGVWVNYRILARMRTAGADGKSLMMLTVKVVCVQWDWSLVEFRWQIKYSHELIELFGGKIIKMKNCLVLEWIKDIKWSLKEQCVKNMRDLSSSSGGVADCTLLHSL